MKNLWLNILIISKYALKNIVVFIYFIYEGLIPKFTKLDVAEPWQIGFQDSASPSMTGLVDLHSDVFYYLIIILLGVSWILGIIIYYFNNHNSGISHKYWTHGTVIELIWTISPAVLLLFIAQPSFGLLYLLDEVISPSVTIKAVGHQWYWSYEYTDYETSSGEVIEFDSYMIPEEELETGQFRLLDVDNTMKIPNDTHIRLIVESSDVLHSYAIPSMAVKSDAVPGRLNQTSILAERNGIYTGQCSEICGTYHGFMPIAAEVINVNDFLQWLHVSFSYFYFNLIVIKLNNIKLKKIN